MKKIQLSIPNPCHQKFSEFTPTTSGGFCKSCKKEVIDFTGMTSQEIVTYFKTNNTQNTCGKFKNTQLKTYQPKTIFMKNSRIQQLGFAVLLCISSTITFAQQTSKKISTPKLTINQSSEFTVKGIVSDQSGALPGVNIILEGSAVGTETDFDGKFEFPKKLKYGNVLVFSFMGMKTKKVIIKNVNSVKNIVLEADAYELLGDVAVKHIYSSKRKNK